MGAVVGMVTIILTVLVFLPRPIAAGPWSSTPPRSEVVRPWLGWPRRWRRLRWFRTRLRPRTIDWQALEAQASLDWAKGAATKLQARTPQEAAQAEVEETQAIKEHEAAESARKAIAPGAH